MLGWRDPDQLESLHNKREQEHYRKATPEYIQLLLETIDQAPEAFGYDFGRWTGERLATYLAEQTGIILSGSQVRRILKRKKFSYIWARSRRTEYSGRRSRAAKYSLEDKQDSEKRAEFKEKLAKYLAMTKEHPQRLQIWFWKEVLRRCVRGGSFPPGTTLGKQPDRRHSATKPDEGLRVKERKCWGKRGQRKKITGQRGHGRAELLKAPPPVNVMGGIREQDRKRVCFFIQKGNADTFYEQVEQLHEFVKHEWIAQGHCADQFQQHGPKIVIILDNASYHKRLDIREQIAFIVAQYRLGVLACL